MAHKFAAIRIKYKLGFITAEDATIFRDNLQNEYGILSKEMRYYTKEYSLYILNIKNKITVGVEESIDLSKFISNTTGTCDCFVLTKDSLHVIDFKYGINLKVRASESTQLKLYALGLIAKYKDLFELPESITLHIYQPRINNIDIYKTSKTDLFFWAYDYLVANTIKSLESDKN